MPLPSVIEIQPLICPVRAEISVPGSKSITNRALILAALAHGRTELRHALWSEDTQIMTECLGKIGFEVEVLPDAGELGNRHILVNGRGGEVPPGGTAERPLELFVGNAGTAARFLAAFLCLGSGVYRLHGIERMHERPQAALFGALRQLGYKIESAKDRLPALIFGAGQRPGKCRVSIEESSQFASALLLAGKAAGWDVAIEGENSEESPYVSMTSELIAQFPSRGGIFEIEPDASSASYIWGADWILRRTLGTKPSSVGVSGWMKESLQIDARFPEMIRAFPSSVSRQNELGDSIMTAIVLAPFADGPKIFTDLGRLRVQECERVQALRTELTRCGATMDERGDTLKVWPGELHGAVIETYNDHRMAMCFGLLGLSVTGMKIKNPDCVRKTFPNFFQKLAAPAPKGLGAIICDGAGGQRLQDEELNAY